MSTRREFLASGPAMSAAALLFADLKIAAAQQAAAPALASAAPHNSLDFGPFDSIRDYVQALDKHGLVLRVRDIDQDAYEGTALHYRLVERFGMYYAPCIVMENVKLEGKWHKGPIVWNHYGHWDTECIAFGIEPVRGDGIATYYKALKHSEQLLRKDGTFSTAPFQEVARDKSPCKEVVVTGDDIDIMKFAFLQTNPADAGRYVNTGSVFTNDKELGKNFGTYRCQIKGPKMLGVNPEPGQGAYQAFMKARERGEKSVQISIALGQDPMTWVVSSSKLNRAKEDELLIVSYLRGKPLQVVKSETNDHRVPAHAEMIIEGEVPLDQPMKAEGPFGEMYGYLGEKKAENFWMNITAITHRKNPWIVNMLTGGGRGFPTAPLEQISVSTMKRFVPSVKMIHSPVEATGLTFVSFKKSKPGEALEVGKRIAQFVPIAKVVVMVDDDLEVLDRVQMMHAIGSRWQPQPATAIIPEARGMPLDPSLTKRPMTSKIVIDATRQWPEEGGPKEYRSLNRALLAEQAPEAFKLADAHWARHVGKWRPPSV